MGLFLIIFFTLTILFYAVPSLRYIIKRASLIVRLNKTVKKLNIKKYGKTRILSRKYKPYFIETEDLIYSIILFPCFFKSMLFFNFNGSMQVRRIGARRYIPIKPYYDIFLSEFDFLYEYEKLPESCRTKKTIRILLLNPAPIDVHIPFNKNPYSINKKNIKVNPSPMSGMIPYDRYGERSTGDGEFIEGFFIVGANSFFKQIKRESKILNI